MFITGVATNLTVEQTARHGTDLGFTVYVVSDCVAAADEATHAASLANLELTTAGAARPPTTRWTGSGHNARSPAAGQDRRRHSLIPPLVTHGPSRIELRGEGVIRDSGHLSLITQPPFVTWRWQGSSLLSGACGRCFHCGRCATSCRQGRLAGTLPAGRFWGGQAVLQAGVAEPVDGPDCAQDAATAGVSPSAQPPGQRRSYRDRRASSHTSAPSKGPWCPERRRGAAGHADPPSRTRAGHGETTSLFVASSCDRCWATSRS